MDADLISDVRRADLNQHPSFRAILPTAFRTLHAVPLAPALLFLILAPQQTGATAEFLAFRSSGKQLPPWLIAVLIIGHLSILWLPVLLVSLPWVLGGAAARFRDHLLPPDHPRTYLERANASYGRSFALLIPCVVALAALFVSLYVVPMALLIREALSAGPPGPKPIMMALHPAMIASATALWLAAATVIAAGFLALSASTVENLGPLRATRRALSFLRDHGTDAAQLWLFAALTGLPIVLLHHATFLVPITPASLVAIATTTSTYSAYTLMLILAVAESLYLARRPPTTAA